VVFADAISSWVAGLLARHCRWLAVLAILSAAVPLYSLWGVRIDNSSEVWLQTDSRDYRAYREFLGRFGNEEYIVIAADMNEPLSERSLALQRDLAARLRTVEGVEQVLDVESLGKLLGLNLGRGTTVTGDTGPLENLLLGKDGRTVGIIVQLAVAKEPDMRRRTVEAVETVAAQVQRPGFMLHLAGHPVIGVELDRVSRRASLMFLPPAAVMCLILLYGVLRRIAGVAAAMCSVGVTVLWTVGVVVMAGRTLNMVTVILPPVLFVLSLSNGIHIAARYFVVLQELHLTQRAMAATLEELMRPAVLAAVTTAAGFASLMVSGMKPISDFGLFCAIGMLLSLVFNLTIVPGLLSLLHPKPTAYAVRHPMHWSGPLGRFMAVHARVVGPVSMLMFAGTLLLGVRATVESNMLSFLPEHSKITADYAFVGTRLTGMYSVEVELDGRTVEEAGTLARMKLFADAIEGQPTVAKVVYVGNLMPRQIDGIGLLSGLLRNPSQAGVMAEMAGRYRVVEDDRVHLRMSVLINSMSGADHYRLIEFIRAGGARLLGETARIGITGMAVLSNDVQRSLVQTQIRSITVAGSVILLMITLSLWSVRAGMAAIVPNFLPISLLFAVMVAAGLAVDAATVMIASIALGIAVDNTIHFLSQYKREVARGAAIADAVHLTLGKVGRAMVFTSVVAAGGFGILGIADFKPIAYFGLLTGFTMLTALAAALLVLPAYVRLLRIWCEKA